MIYPICLEDVSILSFPCTKLKRIAIQNFSKTFYMIKYGSYFFVLTIQYGTRKVFA